MKVVKDEMKRKDPVRESEKLIRRMNRWQDLGDLLWFVTRFTIAVFALLFVINLILDIIDRMLGAS